MATKHNGVEPLESVTRNWVNLCGLLCGFLAAIYICSSGIEDVQKAVAIILSTFAPIIFANLFVFKDYCRISTGLDFGQVNTISFPRILTKLFGLIAMLSIIAILYSLIPEYSHTFYQPFWSMLQIYSPMLVIGICVYFVWIDGYMCEPHDSYWLFGRLCLGKYSLETQTQLMNFIRGWLIKAFFLPLMFSGLVVLLQTLTSFVNEINFNSLEVIQVFALSWMLLFCIDLVFVTAGYLLTLRLLDSHIRSTDSTLIGWFVALICYRPFWEFIQSNYLNYNADGLNWYAWLVDYPILLTLWGMGIVCLLVIYTWSTVSFGYRFSNLTHRGIITSGPYRFSKHPAYIAKNISWWMVAVPFISNLNWKNTVIACVMLLCVNAIYFIRAKSEERHLSNDPIFIAYNNWIANNGLFYKLRTILSRSSHYLITKFQPSDNHFRGSYFRVINKIIR